MTDPAQKEFTQELLAIQGAMGFNDAEFAGMLLGAGVVLAHRAGLNKGQIFQVASKCFEDCERENDESNS